MWPYFERRKLYRKKLSPKYIVVREISQLSRFFPFYNVFLLPMATFNFHNLVSSKKCVFPLSFSNFLQYSSPTLLTFWEFLGAVWISYKIFCLQNALVERFFLSSSSWGFWILATLWFLNFCDIFLQQLFLPLNY